MPVMPYDGMKATITHSAFIAPNVVQAEPT